MKRMVSLSFLLALTLVSLRALYSYEYIHVTLNTIVKYQAIAPFSFRVLTPFFYNVFSAAFGRFSPQCFFFITDLASALMVFGVGYKLLLSHGFNVREATFSLTLLNIVFLLNYVFLARLNIYYPWDLPALGLLSLAVCFVYSSRFWALIFTTFVAVFNRETAVLFPLIYFAYSSAPLKLRSCATLILLVVFTGQEWFVQNVVARGVDSLESFSFINNIRLDQNVEFLVTDPLLSLITVLCVPLCIVFILFVAKRNEMTFLLFPAASLFLAAFIYGNAHEPRVFMESLLLVFYPFVLAYRELRLKRC